MLGFTDRQEILINRDEIVRNALQQYQDISMLSCNIFVKFQNESGHDENVLTKEFFSRFWMEFSGKYLKGNKTFASQMEEVLSEKEFRAVGRILIHGFILTGYLPLFLNHTQNVWF